MTLPAPTETAPAAGEGLAGIFLADSPRAYGWAFIALAVAVVLTAAALLAMGVSHQDIFPWDAAFLLDGGWRLSNGQRPHTDFYSPLGAVPLLLVAAGMWLAGPTVHALATGYILIFPPVTLWAWGLARPRFPAIPALLLASLIGFLLVGTRCLATSPLLATYAMEYNRLGWSLLCLILVQALVRTATSTSARRQFLEGLSTGAALGLLAFTKINYLSMGLAGVTAGVLLFGTTRRTVLGMTLAFGLVTLGLLVYLRLDLAAMLGDLRMLSGVQRPEQRIDDLRAVLVVNPLWLGLLLALALGLSLTLPGLAVWQKPWTWPRSILAALALIGIGIIVCSTNAQRTDIPPFAVAALLLTESYRRLWHADGPTPGSWRGAYFAASLACVFVGGIIVTGDINSIGHSLAVRFLQPETQAAAARPDAAPLRDLVLPLCAEDPGYATRPVEEVVLTWPADDFHTAYQYGAWLNDGIALARRHARPDDRIFTLDWVNPFPFALGLPSPRGSSLFWHNGRVTDQEHHPPAERVFAEVTLVMVPRRSLQPGETAFLRETYGHILNTDFEKVGESRLWQAFRRKSGGPSR